jgi:hypothetical protein
MKRPNSLISYFQTMQSRLSSQYLPQLTGISKHGNMQNVDDTMC